MVNGYANLVWALTSSAKLKLELFGTYQNNPRYLSYLDNLIFELKKFGCKNIQEKIKDADNLYKFTSTVSELEVANFLIKNDKKAQLLPDNYFDSKSPDILCKGKDFEAYIEVTRFGESESSYIVIDFLRDFLKHLPYRVDIKLKYILSLPARDHKKRTEQESIVNVSLEQFVQLFREDTFSEYPFKIKTAGIVFEIYQTGSGKGYPGIVETEVIKVPEDALKANISYWLLKKAEKRDNWEKDHRKYPYIIAIDCKEWTIDDITINALLYGQRTTIFAPRGYEKWREKEWKAITDNKIEKIPRWREIEEAGKSGWEKFLLKEALIPNNYTHLIKEGVFLSESLMKNVSLVLFREPNNVFFFPNPFAYDEINLFRFSELFK